VPEASPTSTRVILETRDVTKRYVLEDVEVNALAGVSVAIRAGEMVSIMGPSGSGKSTLMHIVGLLDTPTTGQVILEAEDVSNLSPNQLAELRNRHIGFVFQAFNLLPRTTAQANVELPLAYGGASGAERSRRARAALERVGLGDRMGHLSNQLSGGQQQRVAIARALVNNPSIVLADEPTGNLDSRSGIEVMAILQELHAQGSTIVLVTHDERVASHADRVIRVFDGRVQADEPMVDRIIAADELAALKAGEVSA
jgi:putative ABC transport system ATP-binding protein